MIEHACVMGKSTSLVGVLADAEPSVPGRPAVIVLNSGLVHHVGPSRIHVTLARRLALEGFPTLRFDFSSIGDSPPRGDTRSFFDAAVDETREAIDWVIENGYAAEVVLVGICSGATFAFRTARHDRRVSGLGLINPQAHLHDETDRDLTMRLREVTLARHYRRIAWRSSFRRKVWLRGLSGAVNYRDGVTRLLSRAGGRDESRNDDPDPEMARVRMQEVVQRGVRVLELHAEADEGLDYTELMVGGLDELGRMPGVTVETISGANHTFAVRWSQERLLDSVSGWITRSFGS